MKIRYRCLVGRTNQVTQDNSNLSDLLRLTDKADRVFVKAADSSSSKYTTARTAGGDKIDSQVADVSTFHNTLTARKTKPRFLHTGTDKTNAFTGGPNLPHTPPASGPVSPEERRMSRCWR